MFVTFQSIPDIHIYICMYIYLSFPSGTTKIKADVKAISTCHGNGLSLVQVQVQSTMGAWVGVKKVACYKSPPALRLRLLPSAGTDLTEVAGSLPLPMGKRRSNHFAVLLVCLNWRGWQAVNDNDKLFKTCKIRTDWTLLACFMANLPSFFRRKPLCFEVNTIQGRFKVQLQLNLKKCGEKSIFKVKGRWTPLCDMCYSKTTTDKRQKVIILPYCFLWIGPKVN